MSNIRLFIDFGSTFTKAVAFDLDKEELAARAQAPSTVDSDVAIGLRQVLELLGEMIPIGEREVSQAVASSSAAGGLHMLCIGMVPEYTTEAGRMAALGAGAKVTGTYSYELSPLEIEEIRAAKPDIILLTGGTDGGNKSVITHNAQILAQSGVCAGHIIVAGNKSANIGISAIFKDTGFRVHYTENVMPELGKINFEPARECIRAIFLSHIIQAKGIARVDSVIKSVLMPTPAAVLEAAKLIALGVPGRMNGMGELLLVDVGGATTDVYSIAAGYPMQEGTIMTGLPEPFEKRTVDGDLGLYHNLDVLVEIARQEGIAPEGDVRLNDEILSQLYAARSVPQALGQARHQLLLARLAVKIAVERHAGKLEILVTGNGTTRRQRGKDLTGLRQVIGTGGPVSFSSDPRWVLEGASGRGKGEAALKPAAPRFYIDASYILFAIGLLSQMEPQKALNIIHKYLKPV
ncbi:MAG: glutamate mutase L [Synergistaceae bacterium]|jgi:uncharacterized protein (TIGR01319 family)|nr:glutamate mutase L [Synergistaceae bacterium]